MPGENKQQKQRLKDSLKEDAKNPNSKNPNSENQASQRLLKLMLDVVFKAFFMRNQDSLILMLENFLPLPEGLKIEKVYFLGRTHSPYSRRKGKYLRFETSFRQQRENQCGNANVSSQSLSGKNPVLIGHPCIERDLKKGRNTLNSKRLTLWFLQTSISFLRQRIL